jgi:hypothetical protein
MIILGMKRVFRQTLLLLLFLLAACSEHRQIANDIDDYSNRLQSYTGITIAPMASRYDLSPPNKLSLKQDIAPLNINLRELYSLSACSVSQLVAERNTSLGKVQLPSTRYAYEGALLVELKACAHYLKNTPNSEKLRNKLKQWMLLKETQLPLVWANLFTQSSETYSHLSSGSDFISGSSSDNFQATKQALRYLVKSKTNNPVDVSALELHLQQLGNSPLLARMWRTQLLLTQELNNISTLLISYLASNSCSTLKEKESIAIMRNIFRIFFAERIQAIGAELNKYHYQLSPLLEEISNVQSIPEPLSAYVTKHDKTGYKAYTEAMHSHIKLWQQIFARCD